MTLITWFALLQIFGLEPIIKTIPDVGGTNDQSDGVRTLKARVGRAAQAHGSTGSPLALVISCVANMTLISLKKSE